MAISPDTRPDPDELLDRLRGEEEKARRGRLRIYFGASAGLSGPRFEPPEALAL